MCERAIEPDVRAALVIIINSESELRFDFLSPTDFDNLVFLTRFLKPFRDWTIQTERVRDFLDMVLPTYDALLSYLEKSRVL